jgi:hypothetical protein
VLNWSSKKQFMLLVRQLVLNWILEKQFVFLVRWLVLKNIQVFYRLKMSLNVEI